MLLQLPHRKIAVVALIVRLIGCNPVQQPTTNVNTATAPAKDELPSVVATTSIICDLTQQVAQETIALKCLVEPGKDPHVYQPTPSDRQAIESANLILYAGYDFDANLIELVKATNNPAVKEAVHEVAVPEPIMASEGKETEIVPDPHIWHDAQNGIRMVETIRSNLVKLAPNNATLYNRNAQEITSELAQIDNWIKSQIGTIDANRRKLVTTHDALGYYVKAYGLSFEGALGGLSTEEAPTAARVSQLVKEIKKTGVPTIFAETTVNPRLIKAVARDAKVRVSEQELFADSLGEKGSEGDTYQKMLVANTETIVEGLGGSYNTFKPQ